MTEQKNEVKEPISDKDWLDLAWKYFQQHAQQRISYFNFFVIFSTILTTGLVSTYQKAFGLPYLGIPIGALQSFLAFMFWKLDERNKFLTKHGEAAIKQIENLSGGRVLIFNEEDKATKKQEEIDAKVSWYKRMYSHSHSYNTIYLVFFCWGILAMTLPFFLSKESESRPSTIEANISFKHPKIDSLKREIIKRDSITKLLIQNIESLNAHFDTLEIMVKEYPQNAKVRK